MRFKNYYYIVDTQKTSAYIPNIMPCFPVVLSFDSRQKERLSAYVVIDRFV